MTYLLPAPPAVPLLPATCERRLALDTVACVDLFALCDGLPDKSIDLILADLPYGTTACEWDEVIPFEPMWAAFRRVIKPRGAIVLTASQPFTSRLVCSALAMFRHEWLWRKNRGSNFANAKREPMKEHESVLVFSVSTPFYYPQPTQRSEGGQSRAQYKVRASNTGKRQTLRPDFRDLDRLIDPDNRTPGSVLEVNTEVGYHPTQKPVALFEYLIRTYTRPGEVVLDPVCGSGTTAIAARNTGRHYVCGDKEPKYVAVAQDRLSAPYTLPLPLDAPAPAAVQHALFEG